MRTESKVELEPIKRKDLTWDMAMRQAIERSKFQPKMKSIQSKVREFLPDREKR